MDSINYTQSEFYKYVSTFERIKGSEGIIYVSPDEVIKSVYYNKDPGAYQKLSCLDESLFTIPKSLIYVDLSFLGISMDNGGSTLLNFLIQNPDLSFDTKVKMALNLKEIGEAIRLHPEYNFHGDINLTNLLYDGSTIRLADIDIMPVMEDILRVIAYYRFWFNAYGCSYFLDNLAINYITYLLLNFDDLSFLDELVKENKLFNITVMYELLTPHLLYNINHPNKVFDSGVWQKERMYLLGKHVDDEILKVRKKQALYLVDYLK